MYFILSNEVMRMKSTEQILQALEHLGLVVTKDGDYGQVAKIAS